MPNKCGVGKCKGNYNAANKCRLFKVPREESEKKKWLDVLPPRENFVLNPAKFFVCEKHWPPNAPMVKVPGGYTRPAVPPSIFNVPSSCLPTANPPPRSTNLEDQQMKHFLKKEDMIPSFSEFSPDKELLKKYDTLIISRSRDKFICVFMTKEYKECKLSVIVENKPTLCSPLIFSAFKNSIHVPLGKILNPNNGLASYSQFFEAVHVSLNYDSRPCFVTKTQKRKKVHSNNMDEAESNFTEDLSNVIKQESQELDEELFSTHISEKQNTESYNFDCLDVLYKYQDCAVVLNSERESASYDKEQHSSKEFCEVKKEEISSGTVDTFQESDELILKEFTFCSSLKIPQKGHSHKKQFKCLICQKLIVYWRTLKNHLKSHIFEKTFQCLICQKHVASLHTLKTHLKNHIFKKTFKCHICQKPFCSSTYLKTHQFVHFSEKPFKCQICQKGFCSSTNLKQHQRVHSGEKPFKCQICQKGFSSSSHLKRHQFVHSGEKPFKCQICQKGFSSSSDAKKHQVVHSSEKPFKCQICQKSFSHNSYLRQHQYKYNHENPLQF